MVLCNRTSIYDALQKERVAIGDVIYVEANSGAVKRVGRSDAYATEFDLEAEEYVPLPKGDVHKKKQLNLIKSYIPHVFQPPGGMAQNSIYGK